MEEGKEKPYIAMTRYDLRKKIQMIFIVKMSIYKIIQANFIVCLCKNLGATMPAKSLGTLTSISKVKTNHPPLPHGTMLVYYQTG